MSNSTSPTRRSQIKHGHERRGHRTRTYRAWMNMVQRCSTNPDSPYFKNYGSRGIRVSPRWQHSFVDFLHDMGECPEGFELERCNNDGNYEEGNCVWATHLAQSRNRRSNRILTVGELTACFQDLCNHFDILPRTVTSRLKRGWSLERAFVTPADKRCWRLTIPSKQGKVRQP